MKMNAELGENYYGKWWDIVDNEFPGYFELQEEINDQPNTTRQEEPQLLSSQHTRFAEKRADPQKTPRDPRIQKYGRRQIDQAPTLGNYSGGRQDRQTEMSRLLARGLTLTDARKYIANREEQDEIERRMRDNESQQQDQQRQTQGTSTRGRGLTRRMDQQ